MSKQANWSEDVIRRLTGPSSPRHRSPSISPLNVSSRQYATPRCRIDHGRLVYLTSHEQQSTVDTAIQSSQRISADLPPSGQKAGDRLLQQFQTPSVTHSTGSAKNGARSSVDYDPVSLFAFIHYDPALMSLGEYLQRVASLQETFGLQFRYQRGVQGLSESPRAGMRVLHDLQVLETIFRPGNVIAPSARLGPSLIILHGILKRIKREVEQDFLEIQTMQRTLHSSDFIPWVYRRYAVQRKPMVVRKGYIRPSHDSLRGRRRDIEDAIAHFSSAEAINDRSATGVMTDIIVDALQRYLASHLAARGPLFKRLRGWLRETIGKGRQVNVTTSGAFKTVRPEDRLVVNFPDGF